MDTDSGYSLDLWFLSGSSVLKLVFEFIPWVIFMLFFGKVILFIIQLVVQSKQMESMVCFRAISPDGTC